MLENEAYWHEQIKNVMPALEIKHYELHQEGLVNDVLIVNDEWVIRFTKTGWGKELMETETCLMRYLHPRMSLSVPLPAKYEEGVLIYPHLHGDTFFRKFWAEADGQQQQFLADQLGQFLRELHGTPTEILDWEVPHTLAPVTKETWLDIYDRVVEKVFPLLLPHQVEWVEHLFKPALNAQDYFDYKPVLIHGDLAPYHLLYSLEKKCLNAVLDFGVAGLGDPATDIGTLINVYGESLVLKLENAYPDLAAILERARFYALAIELQWVLLGVETGEHYWFTAHLGNARDIR